MSLLLEIILRATLIGRFSAHFPQYWYMDIKISSGVYIQTSIRTPNLIKACSTLPGSDRYNGKTNASTIY